MGPLDIHLQRLVGRLAGVTYKDVPGTGVLVTVPSVTLPSGWNKPSTAVHFIAPQGYPFARPDCFWADEDLRLSNGAIPQASNCSNPMPGLGHGGLWFSWHLQQWNANRDDLMSWFAAIKDRFAKAV